MYVPAADRDTRNWWMPGCRDNACVVSTAIRPFPSTISNVTAPTSATVRFTSVVPENGFGLFCDRPKPPLATDSPMPVVFCIVSVVSGH